MGSSGSTSGGPPDLSPTSESDHLHNANGPPTEGAGGLLATSSSSQPSLSPRSSLSSVSPPVSPYEPAAANGRPPVNYESAIRPPTYELAATRTQQVMVEPAIRPPTYEQAFQSSQERQRKLQVASYEVCGNCSCPNFNYADPDSHYARPPGSRSRR